MADAVIPRPPYIKGKGYCVNPVVKYGIPKEADSRRDKKVIGTAAWESYWEEQLHYVHNGYQTGGLWVPGRYYYYMNFSVIATIEGNINPDATDLHLELAYLIEYCKKNGKNLMAPKARRKGISEATHKMVLDYGWRFMYSYKAGIASGKKDFVTDFLAKFRYGHMNLPPELYVGKLLDNDDEIIAGYTERNSHGAWEDVGTKNTIYARTIHSDASGFKGNYYNDIIIEEIGETEKFLEFWAGTRDALSDGFGNQIGMGIAYGCVCAGTKVWNNKGELVNIEDLKQEDGIVGYSGYGTSKEEITWIKPPAKKPCYRIKTSSGNTIECSEDHPLMWSHSLFKKSGNQIKKTTFKRASDVMVGDQLMMIDSVPIFGEKCVWMPRFIGLMIGDGNCTKNLCPTIGSCEPEIKDYVEKNFDYIISKSFLTKDGRIYNQYSFRGIIDKMKAAGIYGLVKDKKRLPGDIHLYDKRSLSELISGYFDADGNVSFSRNGIVRVVLTSVVPELLWQVKYQLTKFGVDSQVVRENRNEKNCGYSSTLKFVYRLYVCKNESVKRFADNFSFLSKNKQDRLMTIYSCKKESRMMAKKCYFEVNQENNKGQYYRDIDFISGIRHETVRSVEFIGEQYVYNLTAGTTHTYLANNFVTGNTGGDINKGSKAFKEAWSRDSKNNFIETNNFIRFVIPAQRFYFYGGAANPKRDLPKESELLKKYKPYQLIGVEDVDLSIKDILRIREEKKNGPRKDYLEFLQNNPINEQEIFRKTVVNNFDTVKLNDKYAELDALVTKRYAYYKLDWKKENGMIKQPLEVVATPATKFDDPDSLVAIHDDGWYRTGYLNRYCAGIDSYNVDESKHSKSLGAMLVFDRIDKRPVAIINCRPQRKEMFYDMCMKLSVMYKMYRNVLGDLASDTIMKHFEMEGLYNYLADRPRKFESENSNVSYPKWIRLNTFSKPRMVGLMQQHVYDHIDKIDFESLIDQIGNYDEVEIGSDNDLADAYGLALIQDFSCDIPPIQEEESEKQEDRWKLPEFVRDRNGELVSKQGGGSVVNPEQDSDTFGLLFGIQKST